MVKVLTLGTLERRRPGRLVYGLVLILMALSAASESSLAQTPSAKPGEPKAGESKSGPQAAPKADAAKSAAPAADASKDDQGADEAAEIPEDPSKTRRVAPVEVFKDPVAEELLNLKKFQPIRFPAALPADVAAVKTMAQNPNMPVDSTTIRRMVNGMVSQLTDTRNIQGLIDPPLNQRSNSSAANAIEEATSNLLEPLFVGRANKSNRFLAEYNRVLLGALPPLLKHHLVPRVQAMMVLGQSGNPDALKLFLDELKNPEQTVWVKLWALRGIINIKQNTNARLSASQEIEAARAIADLLDKNKDLPWPVQLRGIEALTALRHGFVPTSPKSADMAESAMRVLADPKVRTEVRSEAARALGFMQITNAVNKFNYTLVGYAVAMLAADLGEKVKESYADTGTPLNESRAQLMTALLIGPIVQAFEGKTGVRDSGLLHVNPSVPRAELQTILDQVKPVAAAALELYRAPGGQRKARRADLEARIAALKEFLSKNAPADRHLVPDDQGFLEAAGKEAAAEGAAEPSKVAGAAGGR